jgi:lysophospholipase L1-like esterase
MHRWRTFVAMGDSFTEGLNDEAPDGTFIGWADRLAAVMAEQLPDFRYANLAVRGKEMPEIMEEQFPYALAAGADLVSFCAGGNDVLRPNGDVDAVAQVYEDAVAKLRAAGSQVLLFTGHDPRNIRLVRRVRSKVALYNEHIRGIAERHGCLLVDLWHMRALHHPAAFCEDRLHLSPEAHLRIMLGVADIIGVQVEGDRSAEFPPAPEETWVSDVRWATTYLVPWIGRIIRGTSMGDGLEPKRPALEPLTPAARNGHVSAVDRLSKRGHRNPADRPPEARTSC